ncbi:MAG: hypothetical protein WD738_18925 [Pirellulales bacterium]
MTCELISTALSDEQKGQVMGILSVGCDRQTAANFIGCSLAAIRRAMLQDATFAAGVCRAEAGAELNHMRNVQQAANEAKNWRASVWWLERRAPERYGSRGAGVATARQLKAFINILADALRQDVHNADDWQRIIARLQSLADDVDKMIRDDQMNLANSIDAVDLPSPDASLGPPIDSLAEDWDDSQGES